MFPSSVPVGWPSVSTGWDTRETNSIRRISELNLVLLVASVNVINSIKNDAQQLKWMMSDNQRNWNQKIEAQLTNTAWHTYTKYTKYSIRVLQYYSTIVL